jgi:hypothetical protein
MIGLYSAMIEEEALPYTYFDTRLAPQEKRRVMIFYKRCLQRHLYAHGSSARYLSKNPSFTPKVEALYEHFPDARIIYMVRNPLEMIPSYMSFSAHRWHMVCDPEEAYPFREYVLEMAEHWYTYPLERLAEAPEGQYAVVQFEEMVTHPTASVRALYRRLRIPLGADFERTLLKAGEQARTYESAHEYELAEMGLTRAEILTRYRKVFERFGYDGEDFPKPPSGATM